MSCNCNKPKCDGKCGISPSVLQINNPGDCTLFHRVEVPASMGDSKTNPPKNGDYRNVLLYYVADGTSWLFSSDGVPQKLVSGFTDYEDAINLPSINGVTLLRNKTGEELGLQDKLIAGDNIQIAADGKTISATDTTYGPATDDEIGLVKPGDGLSVEEDGALNVKTGSGISIGGDGSLNAFSDDESDIALYAFFDQENNNAINFFVSEDGVKLKRLKVETSITGNADPSIMFLDGKYYLAMTSQSPTKDFQIKVSSNLNDWETYDINVGLYDPTYTSRWAPEWFKDDDNKIYIVLSVQYANTEGWGDFRPWIVECTDINTMTFGTPRRMYLNGATADNHIDAAITKYNGTYRMMVKSDHQTELYTEYYTSNDLINWDLVSVDPCRFGIGVEGQTIFKMNGEYYIGVERYTRRALPKSYYLFSKTNDFQTFTNPVDVSYPDLDISHGGATIISRKNLSVLLQNGNATIEDENPSLAITPCTKDFYAVATQLTDDNTGAGARLGNYLHLFDVSGGSAYRTYNVKFHISSATSRKVDAEYSLVAVIENSGVTGIRLNEIYCSTNYPSSGASLAGHMIAVQDAIDSGKIKVYIDLRTAPFNFNEAINLSFRGEENWFAHITKYTDDFVNEIDTAGVRVARANGSKNSQSTLLDMTTHTKARIVFASRNGCVDIYGNVNGTSSDRILNSKMLVQNGYIAYKNFNPDLIAGGKAITATVENYDSDTTEYTVLFENIPTYSSFGFVIQPSDRSYIKSTAMLN